MRDSLGICLATPDRSFVSVRQFGPTLGREIVEVRTRLVE